MKTLAKLKFVVLLGLILFVRLYFFGVYDMTNTSMQGTIDSGQRVIFNKYRNSESVVKSLDYKNIYLFEEPNGNLSIKELIGKSGDTLDVDVKIFYRNGMPTLSIGKFKKEFTEGFPVLYEDYIPTLILPSIGDTLYLDKISLYYWSMLSPLIKQYNPAKKYVIKTELYVDSKKVGVDEIATYINFSSKKAIPKAFDKLHWSDLLNMEIDLKKRVPYKSFSFKRRMFDKNGNEVTHYINKETVCFFVGSRFQSGLDSRFYGLVVANKIKGKYLYSW